MSHLEALDARVGICAGAVSDGRPYRDSYFAGSGPEVRLKEASLDR